MVNTEELPKLLNIEEAGAFLDYRPNYLRRLARDRKVPAERVRGRWMFYLSRLQEWIAQGCPAQEEQPSLFQ